MHFEGVQRWLVGVAAYPRKRSLANSKITERVEPVRFAHELALHHPTYLHR